MHRLLVSTAVPLAVLVAAAPAAAATVEVGDNYFSPKKLTVPKHSIVTWKFVGDKVHNVTATGGPVTFNSPSKSTGKFVRHFAKKGTYKIVCSIHAGTQRMTLKVD